MLTTGNPRRGGGRKQARLLPVEAVDRIYGWMRTHPEARLPVDLARLSGLSTTTISRVLGRKGGVSHEALDAIVEALGKTRAELFAGLKGAPSEPTAPEHGPATVAPADQDTDVGRQLREIRASLGEIGRALAASPAPFVHAGRPDTTPARIVEFSGGGAVRPMIVQTDQLAGAGLPAGSVAWVDPNGIPSDGKIVRIGVGEFARLKRYAPGDEITGVVVLVQYSPP